MDPDTGVFSPTEDAEGLDVGYLGMEESEAVTAAERNEVSEVRVIRLPFTSAYRLDYKLNASTLQSSRIESFGLLSSDQVPRTPDTGLLL